MKPKHNREKWVDRIARGPLSHAEAEQFRAWQEGQPDADSGLETELALSEVLAALPSVPVSTNFTARVLGQVRAEAQKPSLAFVWLERLRPLVRGWRVAAAGAVVALAVVVQQVHQHQARVEFAHTLAALPVDKLGDPALWRDFEPIRLLPAKPLPPVHDLVKALQ